MIIDVCDVLAETANDNVTLVGTSSVP